ncbi:hypothetical protein VF13_40440 [Nostoc linckia z16]|nr:hypothetical protein VF13_40440 [Nostoc linckia z16]
MKHYNLDISGQANTELALMETVAAIKEKLTTRFGNSFEMTEDPIASPEKTWTHEIKIRKGNKIGVAVEFKWESTAPSALHLDASVSSKLGSMISYGVVIGFLMLGAYLAYNDMAPLEFLPGKKIAGGLGGLLFMIPGAIVAYILKKVILKDAQAENAVLLKEVKQYLTTL